VRVAVLVLLLVLAVAARAQDDDDGALDHPSLGPGIPERIQELEKEWADDVGKDPADEPKAGPEDGAVEPEDADHDDDEHPATKLKLEQPALKGPPPSALSKPFRNDASDKRDAAKAKDAAADASSPPPPPANTAPRARPEPGATGAD
jgi:hypothetical protein